MAAMPRLSAPSRRDCSPDSALAARSRRGGVPSLHRCFAAVPAAALALLLLAGLAAPAQAATLVSNIGQSNVGTNYTVDSSTSYAQQFTTGTETDGYTLSEVVVNIKTGAVATPAFSIHTSSDANRPDTNVVDLTGSVSSAGEQSFVPASVTTLEPSTKYFVMFSHSNGSSFRIQATVFSNMK